MKKNILKALFLSLMLSATLGVATAFAGTCNNPVADLTTCCSTGNQFFSCNQSSGANYMMKGQNNTLVCKLGADITTSYAKTVNDSHWKNFDCFTGAYDSSCISGYCKNSADVCVSITGIACNAALNRNDICPGGCGSCKAGFSYCVNNLPTPIPTEIGAGTLSCQANKDGSTFAANNGKTCAQLGKNVANPCTGQCSTCPEGATASGRNADYCVTYAQRFIEIYEDGFTLLGGRPISFGGLTDVMSYAYGSIGKDADWSKLTSDKAYYGSVFVESDQSDHLNWSSPSVPGPLQDLIANSKTIFCDPTYACPAPMVCTAGICNNPTNTGDAGDACTSPSGCHIGFDCVGGICVDPNAGLTTCTSNAGCTAPQTCVLGYCHNQGNAAGSSCTTAGDCATGLACVSGMCTSSTGLGVASLFVDLTSSTFNGNRTNYATANSLCDPVSKGSHICTPAEMVNSYVANVPKLSTLTEVAWLNSASPSNVFTPVNDCKGWTKSDAKYYGTAWGFNIKAAGIQACNTTLKFACCK